MQRVKQLLLKFVPEINERYQSKHMDKHICLTYTFLVAHQDKLHTTRTVTRPPPGPPHHYGPPPYRSYPPQTHPFPPHHPGLNTYRYRPPGQYSFPPRPRPPH